MQIYEKAIKNCPFEYEFHLGFLREMEKNDTESDVLQQTAIQAIEYGGEQITIEFQFEILKHLCEYYVRSFIVPNGVKPDLENPAVKQKVDVIRGMYTDAMENLTALNPDGNALLPTYIDRLTLTWAEVEAYKIQDKKKV